MEFLPLDIQADKQRPLNPAAPVPTPAATIARHGLTPIKSEAALRSVIPYTDAERAHVEASDQAPYNLAELDREIARTTDPAASAVLQQERERKVSQTIPPPPPKPPMTWQEVLDHPEIKALDFDTREAARNKYWLDVVAPTVQTEHMSAARAAFDADTKPSALNRAVNALSSAADFARRGIRAIDTMVTPAAGPEPSVEELARAQQAARMTVTRQGQPVIEGEPRQPTATDLPPDWRQQLARYEWDPDAIARPAWYQAAREVSRATLLKELGKSAADFPTHLKAAASAAKEGLDPDFKNAWIAASRDLSKKRAGEGEDKETLFPGLAVEDVRQLSPSLAFSVVSALSGLGVGIPAALVGSAVTRSPVGGAVAGYAAGGTASGVSAYRMAANQFLRDVRESLDEQSQQLASRPLSDAEWQTKQSEFNKLAREYGLWEAIPEAVGNVAGAKIILAASKVFGESTIARATRKLAALYGTELTTETVTQQGQHNVGVEAGLSDQPKRSFTSGADLAESLKEIAPVTVLQTTIMAGGAAGTVKAYRAARGEPARAETQPQSEAGNPDAGPVSAEEVLGKPTPLGAAPTSTEELLGKPPAATGETPATAAGTVESTAGPVSVEEVPGGAQAGPAPEATAAAPVAGPAPAGATPGVDAAAQTAATSPTNAKPEPSPAQEAAGNFQMGHPKIAGMEVTIQYPQGATRFKDTDHPVKMQDNYGYIKGVPARAPDKEHVDVFVKPGTPDDYSGPVFVVDQLKRDGKFDEPKIMLGHETADAARSSYLAHYPKGWESRIGAVTPLTMDEFKARLQDEQAFKKPQGPAAHAVDARLVDDTHRAELQRMAGEAGWAEIGGRMLRTKTGEAAGEETITRTKWIPHAAWWPGRPDGLNREQVRESVRKALAGERLSPRETRTVRYMLDQADMEAEQQIAGSEEFTAAELEAPQVRDLVTVERNRVLGAVDEEVGHGPENWSKLPVSEQDDYLDSIFGSDSRPKTRADQAVAAAATQGRPRAAEGETRPPARSGPGEVTTPRSEEKMPAAAGISDSAALELKGQTEAEIAADEATGVATEARKTTEEAKAVARAAADNERDQFTLTGSNRPAEERPMERRADAARRKSIAEMSPDEMRRELLIDPMTGLGNLRAYEESAKQATQVAIDLDALKWINDNIGHAAGDELIRAIGTAIGDATSDRGRTQRITSLGTGFESVLLEKSPHSLKRNVESSRNLGKTEPGSVQRDSVFRVPDAELAIGKIDVFHSQLIVHVSVEPDAETLPGLIDVKTLRDKSFEILDGPSQRFVLGAVLASIGKTEILNSVVGLDAVNVVNQLTGKQLTPEMLLHDKAVLQDAFPVDVDSDVPAVPPLFNPSSLVRSIDAVKSAFARTIAEVPTRFVPSDTALGNVELGAAGSAGAIGGLHADIISRAYRVGGDEFILQANSETEARSVVGALRERLSRAELVFRTRDGRSITKKGVDFSHGIGSTLEEADTALRSHKAEREAAGQRARRGEAPAGVTIRPAEGQQTGQDQVAAETVEAAAQAPAPDREPGDSEIKTKETERGVTMLSRRALTGEDSRASSILTLLSENDELFQYPRSNKTTLEGVAQDVSPRLTVQPISRPSLQENDAERGWAIREGKLNEAEVFERRNGEVWLNIASWERGTGGSEIYAIVGNYAHNAGKEFVGDPNGLSMDAAYRRTEAMLSSTLKFGTTRHLVPAREQLEGKGWAKPLIWKPGDDVSNLKSLLDTSTGNILSRLPQLADLTYNFDHGRFEDKAGNPVTDQRFVEIATERGASEARAGRNTLKRAVLQASLLREEGGEGWQRILGSVLRQSSEQLDPALRQTLYSRSPATAGLSVGGMALQDGKAVSKLFESKLPGIGHINVHEKVMGADVPAKLKQDIRELGGENDTAGAWHNGEIYLFAENLRNPEHAAWVILHEGTHHGLRGMWGRALDPLLMKIYLGNKSVRQLAERQRVQNPKLSAVAATEEALANMGADGVPETVWAQIVSFVRRIVRGLGFKLRLTDGDVRDLVARALRFVKEKPDTTHALSGTALHPGETDETKLSRKAAGRMEIRKEKYAEQRGESGSFHDVWRIYDRATGEKMSTIDWSSEAAARAAADRISRGQGTALSRNAAQPPMPKGRGTLDHPAVRSGYRTWAKKTIDTLDNWLEPIGKLPEKEKYLVERYKTLGRIAKADELAGYIRKAFTGASAEDKKAVYDYLVTAGATPAGIKDEVTQANAEMVKKQIGAVGDALVEHGLLSQEAHDQYRDGYLPRLYLKHLLSEGDFQRLGAGKKPSEMGYLKARKDIPEEVRRVILGEITDPGFLGAVAVAKPLRDMVLLDWLAQISQQKDWVLKGTLVEWGEVNLLKPAATPDMFGGGVKKRLVSAYWLRDEAERIRRQAEYYDKSTAARALELALNMERTAARALGDLKIDHKLFKQIPNTARYGRLRGIWVRSEIYDDLMGVNDFLPTEPGFFQNLLGYGGVGTKITQIWKTTKVALNPPSQIRNFVSNGVLLQLSGVPLAMVPVRVAQAWREIANDGKHWKIAKKYGVSESTFTAQELYRAKRELLDLERDMGKLAPLGKLHRMAAIIMDMGGDLYQKMETIFKTAKIIDAMAGGMSEEKAALEAHKWLFDYSLVHRNVRYLRNAPIGVPFLTFQAKVLPRMAEVALLQPWRFLPWAALLYGMSYALAAAYDVDDDDLEKLKQALPDWLRERGHTMLLPYKDEQGRWQVLDMGYYFPWTNWTELARNVKAGEVGKAVQTAGLFSGPITDLIVAIKTGRDPFTDRDIWKAGDPPARQAAALLNYLWTMAAPPFLTSMGFVGHATRAYTGETDKYGSPRSAPTQAALRLFGVNIYAMEPEQSRAANIRKQQFEIGEVRTAARQKLQDQSLSPKRREEISEEYQTEARRRQEKLLRYIGESGIHPNLETAR